MAIYLEMPKLEQRFPFRTLLNDGDILTTPHWHKELEIIYVKKGVIHMGIGAEAIEAGEGEFVMIAGGRVHYVLASPGSVRYVYQFDEKFFYDLIRDRGDLNSLRTLWQDYPVHSRQWKGTAAATAKKLLDAIYEEDQNKSHAYAFAVKGYLCLLILCMYRNQEYHREGSGYEYCVESSHTLGKLDLIFRYVEDHYMEPVSLEEIAGYMGFSRYYFAKFFKKNVGKTFMQFLNEYRIEKAKWILLNEDGAASEIAERTGFGSIKTYYRLFREIVGMTPREFKAENLRVGNPSKAEP